ncbi:hypothetical protein NC315_16060 [Streptomyces sp. G2]|uniref:hypothetical protein n=1 Tax=Streptomyces sp. G2 TaxID=1684471 RepID=UPI00202F1391|nr:hypothetical protein [Streptomyces sp. G2]MCM1946876.1 hypothetical protein [Streptomyces sp. G2]
MTGRAAAAEAPPRTGLPATTDHSDGHGSVRAPLDEDGVDAAPLAPLVRAGGDVHRARAAGRFPSGPEALVRSTPEERCTR